MNGPLLVSSSNKLYEAPFNALVEYVETECAEKEMLYKGSKYPWWVALVLRAPKRLSRSLRISLGEAYVIGIASIEEDEYLFARETYKLVWDLYTWYKNEYPMKREFWRDWEKEAPSLRYVDNNGQLTDNMFGEDGQINRIDDQYIRALKHYIDIELSLEEEFEQKLQSLLGIRKLL